MFEAQRLVVEDLLLVALPTDAIGRVGDDDLRLNVGEFVLGQRIAVGNVRIVAEAAFDARQRKERVVPVLAVGLGIAPGLGLDAVFDAKQQVAAAAGAVIDDQDVAVVRHLGDDDLGDQADHVVGRVLLTGRLRRDVRPAPLDMLFERGDFRVVEGSEVDLAPFFGVAEEHLLGLEPVDHPAHVEKLLSVTGIDAQQPACFVIELRQVGFEVRLERFVVLADAAQRLALFHQVGVVALPSVTDDVGQVFRGDVGEVRDPFLRHQFVQRAQQAALDHRERKEGHHVGRPLGLLDAAATAAGRRCSRSWIRIGECLGHEWGAP